VKRESACRNQKLADRLARILKEANDEIDAPSDEPAPRVRRASRRRVGT